MNILLNGLNIGFNTLFQIESPVEGLETPQIRTSANNYSGRDGGQVSGQYYSPRLITISGFIIGGTCEQHELARRELQNAIPIRQDLPVQITTFSGLVVQTTARVTNITMPITGPKASRFKIDLYASDPNFYMAAEQSVQIPLEIGGGFILPVILPITFDPGSSPVIINNTGDVIVYPVITILGETTNPVISKTNTGELVEIDVTTGVSDELVIDMLNRTVVLNGGSALSLRSADSDWWGLDVGLNYINYESDDLSDTGVATISWRVAVRSI